MQSADLRTWTSSKGQTVVARFVALEGNQVVIQLENGNTAKFEIDILSQADKQYLAEFANFEIDVKDATPADEPEKRIKFDSKTVEKLDKNVALDESTLVFNAVQTEHFLILFEGSINYRDTAECAERLWNGMSFHHPTFKDKFTDGRRFVLILIEKEDTWPDLVEYNYKRALELLGEKANDMGEERVMVDNNKKALLSASAGGISLPRQVIDDHNTFETARAIKMVRKDLEKKVWQPFRTNILSGSLLGLQMGGVSSFGNRGYFAIGTGHAYYKEVSLCDETQTQLIGAETYEGDDLFKTGGFEDGRNWPKITKKLLRDESKWPTLNGIFSAEQRTLTPEQCVYIFGLSYYMQSTKGRLAAYAKLIKLIETSNQVPEEIEIAKIFGFDSVKDLEKDWVEFMKSTKFR